MEKVKNGILKSIKQNKELEYSLIGFLSNSKKELSYLSDLDFFSIIGSNRPSDYLKQSIKICSTVLESNPNVFIFSSFKQQILLKSLINNDNVVLLHFLQYTSSNHLVIREVNTLPKFVKECFDPINITDTTIFDKISDSYKNREQLLNSNLIRIYYYYDILNESIALYSNITTNLIPERILKLEILHKLKFISQHIGYELLIDKYKGKIEEISLNDFDELLIENRFQDLLELKKEISLILKTDINSLQKKRLFELLTTAYSFFDKIAILKNSL